MLAYTLEFDPLFRGTSLQEYLREYNIKAERTIEDRVNATMRNHMDENKCLASLIHDLTIYSPSLDFDDIQKTSRKEAIQNRDAFVITYTLRHKGNVHLLKYLPRTGMSVSGIAATKFSYNGDLLEFEVTAMSRDVNEVQDRKNRVLEFLRDRSEGITTELEEYNRALPGYVKKLFDAYKQRYLDDEDFLNQV
jgi:hypothetical protein